MPDLELRVAFVLQDAHGLLGRLGFAPAPGRWRPETGAGGDPVGEDLSCLERECGASVLVTLLEGAEMRRIGLADLLDRVAGSGLESLWLPIPDGTAPSDLEATVLLVGRVLERLAAGRTVIVHCLGGIGRSGTIAACVLVAAGREPRRALELVRAARAGAATAPGQEEFVHAFAGAWTRIEGARPYVRPGGAAPAVSSPRENRTLVADLFARGWLRAAIDPATLPSPAATRPPWDRVEGMLLGLAIGDALGNTSEGTSPASRRAEHGEIRDYLPNVLAGGRRVGLPSDDTQLAFWTIEHLLDAGGLDPERLADTFASRRIFGIGSTVRAFVAARRSGSTWLDAAQESAGNGALMRIAPIVLPHLRNPSAALWADATLAGAVTHNDFASNAACVAFVAVLWEALAARAPVPAGFWLDRFVEVARPVEGNTPRYVPRTRRYPERPTTMWSFTARAVRDAVRAGMPAVQACERWSSGAFLLETVPSVLYILERSGNDPEGAIVRAVNDTRDNDTVAAIVGAAVGALHGSGALPPRWLGGLAGRLGPDDDGAVHERLRRAAAAFAGGG